MAIGTRDAGRMHLTLHERAIDKDFIENLTVRVIELRCQPTRLERIEKSDARLMRRQLGTAGVTGCAGLDLLARRLRGISSAGTQ